MAANLNPFLRPLLAAQQGAHVGPGGRAQAMPADERALLLEHARHNKPRDVRHPFTAGPEETDAADRLAQHIYNLMRVLLAAKYFLIEREEDAMVWLGNQFDGAAGHQWSLVSEQAIREPSTSGIGVQSVLYRSLRDMLAAYPSHSAKQDLRSREERDFVWNPRLSAAEHRALWARYFEAYDRGVTRTAHLGPTLQVPAQDWPTRLSEMMKRFPPWILKLIAESPANFADETRAWTTIIETAQREKRGPAPAQGARPRTLQQLVAAEMQQAGVGADTTLSLNDLNYEDFAAAGLHAGTLQQHDAASLHALRNAGFCWRCGSRDHHRSSCPQPASQNERDGMPLATWMVRPTSAPAPSPAPSPAPVIAPLSAVQVRLDRQDALLQSILARLDAPPPSTGVALSSAPSSSPALAALSGRAEPTPTTVAVSPAVAVEPPMIMGGPQPAGYVLAGQNQGMPLWVASSLLAASVMHARTDVQPGNVMGSQE